MDINPRQYDETDRGYERDDSRMAEEQSASSWDKAGKRRVTQELPIARKRVKGLTSPTDSGYERDASSDAAASNNVWDKPVREEETQVDVARDKMNGDVARPKLPLRIGKYVDHSLDPDDPEVTFAPIHRKPSFPESLVAILSNHELSNVIQWMPHGRSFYIIDPEAFASKVLPVYFRHTKISSFNRQLNGYGFRKIRLATPSSGKSHYHPLFLRNLPHLVKKLKRIGRHAPEQSIMYESELEQVSNERPLPTRMSPFYANHIQTMNKHIYQGLQLKKICLEAPSGGVAASSTNGQEASSHVAARPQQAVPSIIYTPSPRPLPQVVYTPPPQQQPHSSPSFESQLLNGLNAPAAFPQGAVFTQSHLPLAGLSPNPASQGLFLPSQLMSTLPFQVQPVLQATQATPATALPTPEQKMQMEAQVSAVATVPVAANQNATQAIQTTPAPAFLTAGEAVRQAQIQLLTNAIAAQLGKGQYFQSIEPIKVVSNSLRVSPSVPQQSLVGIGQAQPVGPPQGLTQQSLDAASSTQLPQSSLLGFQPQPKQQQQQPPQPGPQPQQSLLDILGPSGTIQLENLQPSLSALAPNQDLSQNMGLHQQQQLPSASNQQVPVTQLLSPTLDISQLMNQGMSNSPPAPPGLSQQARPSLPQQTAATLWDNYLAQQQQENSQGSSNGRANEHSNGRANEQHTREHTREM